MIWIVGVLLLVVVALNGYWLWLERWRRDVQEGYIVKGRRRGKKQIGRVATCTIDHVWVTFKDGLTYRLPRTKIWPA